WIRPPAYSDNEYLVRRSCVPAGLSGHGVRLGRGGGRGGLLAGHRVGPGPAALHDVPVRVGVRELLPRPRTGAAGRRDGQFDPGVLFLAAGLLVVDRVPAAPPS